MRSLADIAVACGYTIVKLPSDRRGNNFLELSGNGRWHALARESMSWLRRTTRYDHVMFILQDPLGGREVIDIGEKGERRGRLPSTSMKAYQEYRNKTGFMGVTATYRRYAVHITAHGAHVYLGMYDTAIEAAMARDRYVIENQLDVPLNFPHMNQLVRKGMEVVE